MMITYVLHSTLQYTNLLTNNPSPDNGIDEITTGSTNARLALGLWNVRLIQNEGGETEGQKSISNQIN